MTAAEEAGEEPSGRSASRERLAAAAATTTPFPGASDAAATAVPDGTAGEPGLQRCGMADSLAESATNGIEEEPGESSGRSTSRETSCNRQTDRQTGQTGSFSESRWGRGGRESVANENSQMNPLELDIYTPDVHIYF